jgi:hypothetical protein
MGVPSVPQKQAHNPAKDRRMAAPKLENLIFVDGFIQWNGFFRSL